MKWWKRDDEKAFYWYSRAYAAGQKQTALPLAHLYLRASENPGSPDGGKIV